LRELEEQTALSDEVLRANTGIPVDGQIALAQELRERAEYWYPRLRWTTPTPTSTEIRAVCELIWNHLNARPSRPLTTAYTTSARQLARQLMALQYARRAQPLIASELISNGTTERKEIDETVSMVCDFLRKVAGFSFPVRLRALDRIQRDVFGRLGATPGDLRPYAGRVEALFLDPPLVALDEYGIPPELAEKLGPFLHPDGDLDGVLERLAAISVDRLPIDPFESELIRYAQSGLR
jgi:hypothetical protein